MEDGNQRPEREDWLFWGILFKGKARVLVVKRRMSA